MIRHLGAEDAYTEAVMKPTAALQDALFKEMVGHIKEDDDSAVSTGRLLLFHAH